VYNCTLKSPEAAINHKQAKQLNTSRASRMQEDLHEIKLCLGAYITFRKLHMRLTSLQKSRLLHELWNHSATAYISPQISYYKYNFNMSLWSPLNGLFRNVVISLLIHLVSLITLVICVKTIQTSLLMKATLRSRPTPHCIINKWISSQFCTLTFNHFAESMTDPVASRWLRPSSKCLPPTPAHWGQHTERPSLSTHGLAQLVWNTIVITVIVTWIKLQERPH